MSKVFEERINELEVTALIVISIKRNMSKLAKKVLSGLDNNRICVISDAVLSE